MTLRMMLTVMLGAAVLAALGSTPGAQTPSRSVGDGVYTAAQAMRGKTLFADKCAVCHGEEATGIEAMGAPALVGEKFAGAWGNKTLADLFLLMRETMPQNEPGGLTPQQYADVLAHLLSINKFPAGNTELAGNSDALKQIRFGSN